MPDIIFVNKTLFTGIFFLLVLVGTGTGHFSLLPLALETGTGPGTSAGIDLLFIEADS